MRKAVHNVRHTHALQQAGIVPVEDRGKQSDAF